MPAPITISIPGSGDVSLVHGQQLIINFTETVFLCYTCTTTTNLFTNSPFPPSGSQHVQNSNWSGEAIVVTTNQTIEFWTSTSGNCADLTAGTHHSITVGSTSEESERSSHAVTSGSTKFEAGATKHSITIGSTS